MGDWGSDIAGKEAVKKGQVFREKVILLSGHHRMHFKTTRIYGKKIKKKKIK